MLELQLNPNNTLLMNVGGGYLLMRSRVNGVNDETNIGYDPGAHRHWLVDDASTNPTFYADLRNPQSLNKYQYAYNNPLRYIDPDGHDPLDPPQNPACPCLTPAQAEQMKKDVQNALDWVAGVTGITAVADAIRENVPAAAKRLWIGLVLGIQPLIRLVPLVGVLKGWDKPWRRTTTRATLETKDRIKASKVNSSKLKLNNS